MPGDPRTLPTQHAAAIRRLLGTDPTAEGRAQAVARMSEQLSDQLARVVGRTGIRSVFERSALFAQRRSPWLTGCLARSEAAPWGKLHDCIQAQSPEDALDGGVALIDGVVCLLGRLIGDDLTSRLLQEQWPHVFATTTRPLDPDAKSDTKKEST